MKRNASRDGSKVPPPQKVDLEQRMEQVHMGLLRKRGPLAFFQFLHCGEGHNNEATEKTNWELERCEWRAASIAELVWG